MKTFASAIPSRPRAPSGRAVVGTALTLLAVLTTFAWSASARPPVWTPLPNQAWTVGVPVSLDLSLYCSDPDGDPLTFGVEGALPAGVSLTGHVVSGTPTTVTADAAFVFTADDGQPYVPTPSAPANLHIQ